MKFPFLLLLHRTLSNGLFESFNFFFVEKSNTFLVRSSLLNQYSYTYGYSIHGLKLLSISKEFLLVFVKTDTFSHLAD